VRHTRDGSQSNSKLYCSGYNMQAKQLWTRKRIGPELNLVSAPTAADMGAVTVKGSKVR